MTIAEMVTKQRERAGLSREELAKRLKIPAPLLAVIEEPSVPNEQAIELFASTLAVPVDVFTGRRAPEPTEQEKRTAAEAAAAAAKAEMARTAAYPAVRQFILDPSRCRNPDTARKLFGDQRFSLPERNVVLYLSTTALYHFCDTNTSSFSFDTYLFALHGSLLSRFQRQLDRQGITGEERERRLGAARSNIFVCDTMASIAIGVLDSFTAELEEKLQRGDEDFGEDLDLPLSWEIDETMMRIVFFDSKGEVKDEVNLLDVKERP
jgi:transcriptional regulator with XRE-family HTH domain